MGKTKEELEATVLLECYGLVALTETWWDKSHDWSVAVSGYMLCRGTGEEGVAEVLPSTSRNGESVKSCPRRIAMSRSKAYG